MPTVNLLKSEIESKLGKLTEDQFQEICFEFGIELDEVTSEYEMVAKEQGSGKAQDRSKEIIYKIDVPANRYDLLCAEGLIRALMIFQKRMVTPKYICNPTTALVKMVMTQATQKVRPFAVAAILKDITFTKERYESFIGLQDKIHQNIGRKRTVVSIGTHDLDTIETPFIYDARSPKDIKFVPLNESRSFTAEELMIHYSTESHLKPYLHIIQDSEVYPVIYDSRGSVLSMPPIINGDLSKIKLTTKNVFIEITATNLHKASIALDVMVTMFSEYCSTPFQVEPVEIIRPDGSSHQYPELSYRMESVSVDYINKYIGINLAGDEMASLLEKMSLKAEVSGSVLSVEVPPTRHDIIQRCDIVEDVAIAFGYDKVPRNKNVVGKYPDGGIQLISKLTYDLRVHMAINGFTEALTFALCSKSDVSSKLGKELRDCKAVEISNPKTHEFQVVRTSLVPGIMNTIYYNQHLPLPIRLFEVQDVVLLDPVHSDVGARNERRLCAVHYGMLPDFEYVQDTLLSVMSGLGHQYHQSPIDGLEGGPWYTLEEVPDPMLWSGRSFAIKLTQGRCIGRLGILLPSVTKAFNLKKGYASMFEMEVEPFL